MADSCIEFLPRAQRCRPKVRNSLMGMPHDRRAYKVPTALTSLALRSSVKVRAGISVNDTLNPTFEDAIPPFPMLISPCT